MPLVFPVTVYCISLLCLQLQALPVRSFPGGNRLDFKTRLHQLKENSAISQNPDTNTVDPNAIPSVPLDRTSLWRTLLSQSPPAPFEDHQNSHPAPFNTPHPNMGASGEQQEEEANRRGSRGRRHAHPRSHQHHPHHGQLMRVGCVLGTCQVQNLSHRLYQLVGQTGREDSSPINPRSPHSYG